MALTKVTGQVIKNTTDVTVGVLTVTNTLAVGGTVSIGGTLTYEDVTNIDSVGLITARNGIVVGSGITLSKDGDVFFTGIATGNGSGLTALNASNLASGTVPTARLGSGTASSSTFLRGDSTFQTVNTDLVSDTSPQLGGDLASNGNNIVMADTDEIRVGTGGDLQLFHDATNSHIYNATGNLRIRAANNLQLETHDGETHVKCVEDGAVELYWDNSKKFETYQYGIKTTQNIMIGTHAYLEDNGEAIFGDGSDLKIYHNGSHSVITNSTGTLFTLADNVSFKNNANNQTLMTASANGAVDLYHSNIKRLETQSGGARVYGHLGVNVDPNNTHPLRVDHDQQYLIGIRNTAADSSYYPWLCHKEINSKQAFAIHINGKSGDPFHADEDGAIYLNKETSTANALDDYEYGSWTPTFPNGSGGSQTTGTYIGRYTKIGKFVYAFTYMGNMTGTAPNNSSGWNIGGLPFAAENLGLTHRGTGNITYTGVKNYDVWRPLVTTNNRIYFHRVDGSGATLLNQDVASIGMTHFIIGVTYMTT